MPLPEMEAALNKAIARVTSVTYPATVETVSASDSDAVKSMRKWAVTLTIAALLIAVCCQQSLAATSGSIQLWSKLLNSLLAIAMGLLGSLLYFWYRITGKLKDRTFFPDNVFVNLVTFLLGATTGWLFYFFKEALAASPSATSQPVTAQSFLLPFLAGYSTELALGVLNKAIETIKTTLHLDISSKPPPATPPPATAAKGT